MHIKRAFAIATLENARSIVRAHPFATIVTADLRAMGETAREMADKVIAFRLRAESWHAEAKLSQDKPADERDRVLAGLQRPGPYANGALAEAMRRLDG